MLYNTHSRTTYISQLTIPYEHIHVSAVQICVPNGASRHRDARDARDGRN